VSFEGVPDLLVVGAGLAGLSCARRAAELGMRARVLDRARGVGGRCATRRVEGQPVDHGIAFLHGADPGFLAALDAVEATPLRGWPERVRGRGTPCHPATLSPRDRRLAFAEGVSAFPKHLARGLEVRTHAPVAALELSERRPVVRLEDGQGLAAPLIVLALACEETLVLLDGGGEAGVELAAMQRLLRMLGTLPCCTVLAGYGLDVEEPAFDVWYPEDSTTIQLLSHDSAKRLAPRFRVLVIQAHARWSRQRLTVPPEVWAEELLDEAARLAGPWVRRPAWSQAHLWRHGRTEGAGELTAPVAIPVGGGRLGLAGDLFHAGGGAQAAYLSGRALAERLAAGGDA
jgi:predicted NAD/FAD-dependent oxidoreductase